MENNYSDSYETGSTVPPKNNRGLIAFLLVAVILLLGTTTVLGVMNVQLFTRLDESGSSSANFTPTEEASLPQQTDPTTVTTPAGDIDIDLNKAPGSVDNVPQEGGLSLQAIYEKAIDSVVSISCTLRGGTSTGTGVVLTQDGYIATNSHVVADALGIKVLLTDGRELDAVLVGADAVSDLAVLYVEAKDLTAAEFGDSADLKVGDSVVAIGDPLGIEFRGTMTDGIISAINRDLVSEGRTMTLIQTNAALNSGNSGGPLLNCFGQVIGINTMKISTFVDDAGVEGLGFAIPSAIVKEVVDQLMEQGYVTGRPTLGIQGDTVTQAEQMYYRLPAGVLITEADPHGCAAVAGLAAGDIITQINDTAITGTDALQSFLYGCKAGDKVTVTIYRYTARQYYTVTFRLDQAT